MIRHHVINYLFIIGLMSVGTIGADAADSGKSLTAHLPQAWEYQSDFSATLPSDDSWWQSFDDAILDSLISIATDNNFNLAIAKQRIDIARNNTRLARSAYYPTIGVAASWQKAQSSGAVSSPSVAPSRSSYFDLGVTASWEVDLFGKITSSVKAKDHLYQASRADYAAAMVALCSELATDYMQLRVWQSQRDLANRHIATQQKIVDLTEARLEAGIGSMLDVTQAKIVLSSTQASLPNLDNSISTIINSIATLCGVYADELPVNLDTYVPLPDYHQIVGVGIPAELLRRRPDVVEAEMQLAAAAAQLGVAKKDFLPTLTIDGSIGTQAHKAGDLFGHNSLTYSVVPTLSWTVFSGLSRTYTALNARRQMELQIESYNLTVMQAVCDVDNAMSSYLASVKHISLIDQVVQQSRSALKLAVDLYKQGLTNFSNVSDAQLSLLESQSDALSAHGDALSALINLYEALGGGWSEL